MCCFRRLMIKPLLITLLFTPFQQTLADEFVQRRAEVGLKLFRTFVNSDMKIENKAQDNQLLIILTYANDQEIAQQHQQKLQSAFSSVNRIPVIIQAANLQQLLQQSNPKPAAIFISQPLNDDERKILVNYSIEQSVILFSPYQGDVEQGVLAGISVQATVRPLINMSTMEKGGFHIKSFYLKVAKQYE